MICSLCYCVRTIATSADQMPIGCGFSSMPVQQKSDVRPTSISSASFHQIGRCTQGPNVAWFLLNCPTFDLCLPGFSISAAPWQRTQLPEGIHQRSHFWSTELKLQLIHGSGRLPLWCLVGDKLPETCRPSLPLTAFPWNSWGCLDVGRSLHTLSRWLESCGTASCHRMPAGEPLAYKVVTI